MPAPLKKFDEFDWSASEEWQRYYSQIYPAPDPIRLNKIKRKWYKREIDSEFNVDEAEDPVLTQPASTNSSQIPQRAGEVGGSQGTARGIPGPSAMLWTRMYCWLYLCSLAFVIVSLLPIRLFKNPKVAGLLTLGLGMIAQLISLHGLPKLTRAYWTAVMTSEACQSLLILLVVVSLPYTVFIIPSLIFAIVELADALPIVPELKFLTNQHTVRTTLANISRKKFVWLQYKSDIEVYGGLFILVFCLLGRISFLIGFMYWNALRLKYGVNGFTRCTFNKAHVFLSKALGGPMVPRVIGSSYQTVASYLHKFATFPPES